MKVWVSYEKGRITQMYKPKYGEGRWSTFGTLILLNSEGREKFNEVKSGVINGFWVNSDTGAPVE